MLQKPRGTRDFLPEEMKNRRRIEGIMREKAELWGYGEVCTPEFEHLELFTMRSGEGIIQEMYAFEDKGGRKLALRPELTAAVLRMYVNEGRTLPKPLRWFYFADCFRYERPQKGRYRQFWQFGVELIGADTAAADAEVILIAHDLLSGAGLTFEMQVGHLAPMRHLLSALDEHSQRVAMAFLDKRDFDGLAVHLAGSGQESLLQDLRALTAARSLDELAVVCGDIPEMERIRAVVSILEGSGIHYVLNFGIARGLDYYTGTVFEAFAENLGAENQVLGGGAYRLAHLFGGDDAASCGFAIGFDRVMVALGDTESRRGTVAALLFTPDAEARAFEVAGALRSAGIVVEINLQDRGIGAQLKHAGRSADFAVILGPRECESGVVTLRDLRTGEQNECTLEQAIRGVKGSDTC
jgi:histidyl-tRNA synthetase